MDNEMKLTNATTIVLFALPLSLFSGTSVSWSWDCSDSSTYADNIAVKTNGLEIGERAIDEAASFSMESVTGTAGLKSGAAFMKMTQTGKSYGKSHRYWHYATVRMPESVTNTTFDSYTLSFDYAPTRGGNDNVGCSFGFAVRGKEVETLATLYGSGTNTVSIYCGDTSGTALCDAFSQGSGIALYTSSAESELNWFHVDIVASASNGTRVSISTNGVAIVSDAVLSSMVVAPTCIDFLAGYYAKQNYFCVDDFAFSGTTIYDSKYVKSVDCTFEEASHQEILTNGFVTSTLLGTTAGVEDSVNWTVEAGETVPKSGEKFAYISSEQNSRKGLLVNMPSSVTKATEYILEFDALVMTGYSDANTNGIAIVGKSGTLATLWVGGTTANLYKGDSEDTVLASEVPLTGYNGNIPTTTECIWYHFIVRGDSENGVRLSMQRLDTGVPIVQNVALGSYDTVTQLALTARIHSSRVIYAAVDDIKVWTGKNRTFAIIIR